jgi:hypothetical protein
VCKEWLSELMRCGPTAVKDYQGCFVGVLWGEHERWRVAWDSRSGRRHHE